MGPQSCDCGKQTHPTDVSGCVALQWGRSLATAEKPTQRHRRTQGRSASMGPQSCDCGKHADVPHPAKPRKLQWGRSLATAESTTPRNWITETTTLQWGRSLATAESRSGAGLLTKARRLQWGRSLATAESRPAAEATDVLLMASMGPQSCDCGKALTTFRPTRPSDASM